MSLDKHFNHRCDVYHIKKVSESPGYGLPTSPAFSYAEKPDLEGVKCHFGVKSRSMNINQTSPINILEERTKLTYSIGVDIRLNDKIIDCDTGREYTADIPVRIRDHHMFVYVKKKEGQKVL